MNVSLDDMIEKVMKLGQSSIFTVNDRYECRFFGVPTSKTSFFSEWKKDPNSPALMCEANLLVTDKKDYTIKVGAIHLQQDKTMNDHYYASLLLKSFYDGQWERLLTIVDIDIPKSAE